MDINKSEGRKGGIIICPYVGFSGDPDTALSYPSHANCCHHAKPVISISLAHQRNFCLTPKFKLCPVSQKEKIEPLPKEFAAGVSIEKKNKALFRIILLVGAVLIGLLLLALMAGMFQGQVQSKSTASSTMVTESVLITQTPTLNVLPTDTAPEPTRTPTRTPTLKILPTHTTVVPTPTHIPMHQLETPFGETPRFVIHRVIDGETFIFLSEKYSTSKEAIVAINFGMQPVLWANTIIVIPVGMTDVTGLPSFSTFMVAEQGMTIEDLATKVSVDVTLLKLYNALPNGYVFDQGEWVLIPH
jgi:LysM repeat protein